jgi:hypothetical protein
MFAHGLSSPPARFHTAAFSVTLITDLLTFYIILDWGPVPHFCPLEALQPVWRMPEAYRTIPRFLIVPSLAARCLSRPQPAVVL